MSEVENQLAVGKYRQKTRQTKIGIHLMNSVNLIIDFKYQPSRQTTWISPLPSISPRKNPYRNQIDYSLVRKIINSKVFDTRSLIVTWLLLN